MRFKHTNRPGFLLGFIDFFTAGIFFLLYMPLGGLQDELDEILGHSTQKYWKAYLLGIPTLFIYTLVWMSRIAEELKAKAMELGIEGAYSQNFLNSNSSSKFFHGGIYMKQRRIMAVLLCILMVVVMMPTGAFASDGAGEDNPYLNNSNVYGYAVDRGPSKWGKARDVDPRLLRIAGQNRIDTALAVAEFARTECFNGTIPNVILVSGMDFPDALGAAGPAYDMTAPIILVDKYSVKKVAEYVGQYLNASGRVFIMGGKNAVPESMESELVAQGIDSVKIMRLAGANRYETNIAVLDGYTNIDTVLVCSGKDFADALSASALGLPILLVGDKLTDVQKEFIKEKGTTLFGIVGGPAAVSAEVEAELKAIEGAHVDRFAGSNRFETSRAFAEYMWAGTCEVAVLSYGLNFPDGLSGATMCFICDCPMLLATNSLIGPAAAYAKDHGVENIVVMGGEGLISDEVALSILQ